jgi:hypothetical protein
VATVINALNAAQRLPQQQVLDAFTSPDACRCTPGHPLQCWPWCSHLAGCRNSRMGRPACITVVSASSIKWPACMHHLLCSSSAHMLCLRPWPASMCIPAMQGCSTTHQTMLTFACTAYRSGSACGLDGGPGWEDPAVPPARQHQQQQRQHRGWAVMVGGATATHLADLGR